MKAILTLIIGLFCSVTFAQEILVIDQNTGKEYRKDLSTIIDTSVTKVIPNLTPNLKVYTVVREARPSYDRLTETLNQTKTFIESIPNGEVYPVCVYSWNVISLDSETIRTRKKIAVKQREMEAILDTIPDNTFKKYMILVAGMYAYEHFGNPLTAKMEEVLQDDIMPSAIQVWQNFVATQNLLEDLDLDPNTNIDEFLK